MSYRKLFDLFPLAIRWALFGLGAGELAFVLLGPIEYLLVDVVTAVLLVVYLTRVERGNNFSTISGKVLATSLALLILTITYDYLVRVEDSVQLLILNLIGAFVFFVIAHLTAMLLKGKYVA